MDGWVRNACGVFHVRLGVMVMEIWMVLRKLRERSCELRVVFGRLLLKCEADGICLGSIGYLQRKMGVHEYYAAFPLALFTTVTSSFGETRRRRTTR